MRTDIKGRLLTPEEGCGYSKLTNTRIVGGVRAKAGNEKLRCDFQGKHKTILKLKM